MGNKVKVRARQTRGSGNDDAQIALNDLLVNQYDNTKSEYD